jgi:hypothetical protein
MGNFSEVLANVFEKEEIILYRILLFENKNKIPHKKNC